MNWRKLLQHDLRCGLLRVRYLAAGGLLLLTCFSLWSTVTFVRGTRGLDIAGTWMDYLLCFFRGKEQIIRINPTDGVELPISWLVAVGSCLFLNLDYLLGDLTNAGQQIIIRARTRQGWYLSKCTWNLCATTAYFAVLLLTALAFTLLTGGKLSLENTPELTDAVFDLNNGETIVLTAWQGFTAGVLLPFLTIAALSMLEMTLCLFVKPILSFLICMGVMILSVYWYHPLALGNGAMAVRSAFVTAGGISPSGSALIAVIVIILCVIFGAIRFQYTDILGLEE